MLGRECHGLFVYINMYVYGGECYGLFVCVYEGGVMVCLFVRIFSVPSASPMQPT